MKNCGTLLAVTDMDKSKKFYETVLGLKVVGDFGANVQLEEGVFLQTVESWKHFIRTDQISLGSNNYELYFEENDMDSFLKHLSKCNVTYVHEPLEHSWGQKAVRFYDVDHHIIEVAESISSVVKRFVNSGLTEEETAVRMDVPLEYVQNIMNQ